MKKSSVIKSVTWYNTNKIIVEFHSGAIYLYSDVDKELHDRFVTSDSIGRFFNQYITHLPYLKLQNAN